MTQFVIANNVNTQLATAASSAATTLTLASSANLPTLSAGQIMPLTLNDAATGAIYEVVYVTAISGVTLTVVRAQEGTGAQNWNIGDYAFCAPTAGTVATALGNSANTFSVAPATASQHAMQLGQFSAQAIATGLVRTVKRQTFNSSGTYTPSTGMLFCDVELYGGGGGGGGAVGGSGGGGAGGGGAGGYCRKLFTAAQIGASQTVTVGAAGTGAAAGNNTGGAGGNSLFGSYLAANGGNGGSGAASNSAVGSANNGGGGGQATGGDVNLQGATGGVGMGFGSIGAIGGAGGGTLIGHGGGQSINNTGNGGTGAGAAGGGASALGTSEAGGSAYQGFCFITEYCNQ